MFHPDWDEAMIEDYLNIFENLITIAQGVEDAMPKVPDAEEGNIPIFDDEGQVIDSGESIDTLRAKSYFYGRVY